MKNLWNQHQDHSEGKFLYKISGPERSLKTTPETKEARHHFPDIAKDLGSLYAEMIGQVAHETMNLADSQKPNDEKPAEPNKPKPPKPFPGVTMTARKDLPINKVLDEKTIRFVNAYGYDNFATLA